MNWLFTVGVILVTSGLVCFVASMCIEQWP